MFLYQKKHLEISLLLFAIQWVAEQLKCSVFGPAEEQSANLQRVIAANNTQKKIKFSCAILG